jgi:hypothetical protein
VKVAAIDYTVLSLLQLSTELEAIARDTRTTFGALSPQQLNWRPDATRWSVAQCFDHLIRSNDLMFSAADAALSQKGSGTLWERLPILPRLVGRMMVRSQQPDSTRRFKAFAVAQPATSDIQGDVIERFVEQQHEALSRMPSAAEPDAGRKIMTSPFVKVVTYSVLDGWRLLVAHERRHFEQARRVMQAPGFPHG